MITEITNSFEDIGDFDFFDFSDVDPVEVKKSAIANDLCALIAHENLSRVKLARKLNWKPSRLSRVLSGKQNLTVRTITDIAVALDYDFKIYFHKKTEVLHVQPWESTLRSVPKAIEQTTFSKNYLVWNLQTCDEVENDIKTNNSKDFYISLDVPLYRENVSKNIIDVSVESKKLSSADHQFKDFTLYNSKMVTENV